MSLFGQQYTHLERCVNLQLACIYLRPERGGMSNEHELTIDLVDLVDFPLSEKGGYKFGSEHGDN